jgi:hypothetical protein
MIKVKCRPTYPTRTPPKFELYVVGEGPTVEVDEVLEPPLRLLTSFHSHSAFASFIRYQHLMPPKEEEKLDLAQIFEGFKLNTNGDYRKWSNRIRFTVVVFKDGQRKRIQCCNWMILHCSTNLLQQRVVYGKSCEKKSHSITGFTEYLPTGAISF